MSDNVRDTHKLLTLRIRIEPSRSEVRVVFQGYRGRETLGEVSCGTEEIGIRQRLDPREYRNVRFRIPDEIKASLVTLLEKETGSDEPVWLQIDRSSGLLAVVPWEQLLVPLFDAPMLRIPNFVSPPPELESPITIAVCASSPRAKQRFDVAQHVEILLNALANVGINTRVHVFIDEDVRHAVTAPPGGAVEVVLHPPPDEGEGTSGSSRRRSPWLSWMLNTLASEPVDVVCFVCPGYFSGCHGSLALAQSPTGNEDTRWSHFVDQGQLYEFLQRVGARSLSLISPYPSVWSLGLRILADELVWARPGALLVVDSKSNIASVDLAAAFSFVLGTSCEPPLSEHFSLNCHPKCLQNVPRNELGIDITSANPGFDSSSDVVRSIAQIRTGQPTTTLMAWQVTGLQGVAEDLATIQLESPARRDGKADALMFMTRVMGGEESTEEVLGWLSDELKSKGRVDK